MSLLLLHVSQFVANSTKRKGPLELLSGSQAKFFPQLFRLFPPSHAPYLNLIMAPEVESSKPRQCKFY